MSMIMNLKDDFYGSFSRRFLDNANVRTLSEWEQVRAAEAGWKCANMAMVRLGFAEAVNTQEEMPAMPVAPKKVGYLTP